MGQMKELYMAIRQGEIEQLRHKIEDAEQTDQTELEWQGRLISVAHAMYLVQFSDTFLKGLTDDNIHNTDNESKRLV
jgi:hypothetical protein